MAEKRKDEGVLGNLPATRPSRMSRRAREDAPAPAATRPAAKAKKTPAKKVASAAKAKPAAPKKKPAPKATAAPPAPTPVTPRKPRPVRPATPELKEPAAKAEEARPDEVTPKPQSGTDLAVTVVKAAGELAQIGLTVGGQIIKRAIPGRKD